MTITVPPSATLRVTATVQHSAGSGTPPGRARGSGGLSVSGSPRPAACC
ncbi:hypothetical protein [Kitasatospora sp. NPDC088783]